MTKRILPTPEQLRELLTYNPDTGKLYWKERDLSSFTNKRVGKTWNSRYAGQEALTYEHVSGYRQGMVLGICLKAHRVAWAIFHGAWPVEFLDHSNCDKSDNRMTNLRLASKPQNGWNVGRPSTNTSGYKGVTLLAQTGRWRARITVNGEVNYLGCFDNPELAHAAYCKAAKKYHGEFARTE